jgi:hypothetical protein
METILQKEKYNLKSAQDIENIFADLKITHAKFNVGYHYFIKVKPKNSALKLGKITKLAPRYCGPFRVLTRMGPIAYQLALPSNLKVNNVFHVSLLKKYVHDITHVVNWNVIQVEPECYFQVELLHTKRELCW